MGRARDINETTLREFLQAAEARNHAAHMSLTHCIPCSVVFPEQPAEFEVGMVKFQLMKTFLAANEERIRKRAEHREASQAAADTRASAETRNAQSAADMLFDESESFLPDLSLGRVGIDSEMRQQHFKTARGTCRPGRP